MATDVYMPVGSDRYRYGSRMARNRYSHPEYGAPQFENQVDTVINPILRARADAAANAINPGVYLPAGAWNPGSASPWGAMRTNPATPPNPGLAPVNPFTTVSNVKNPKVQSILDKVLGTIDTAAGADMNSNPYVLNRNTKDAAQAGRIAGVGGRLDASSAGNRSTLADFTSRFLAGQGAAEDLAKQEAGAIGDYYSGEVDSRLGRLAKERELAVARSVDRALGRARGDFNSQRLVGGDSSALNTRYLNTIADVMAEEARQQADLGRSNYIYGLEGRSANAGRRNALMDAAYSRMLLPIQAGTSLNAAELSQLGALGDLTNANTVYNIDTPESILARRLGVLGQATQLDQANNFYGVTKPYEPDFSGYLPIGNSYRTGGGAYPSYQPVMDYAPPPSLNYEDYGPSMAPVASARGVPPYAARPYPQASQPYLSPGGAPTDYFGRPAIAGPYNPMWAGPLRPEEPLYGPGY